VPVTAQGIRLHPLNQQPAPPARTREKLAMPEFYLKPGDSVSFAKTVGETDIYLFAGITGDFAVNHVNEQYMARSKYGRRIAHGVLMLGFASTCSTLMIEKCNGIAGNETAVSLGYDKVRFLAPVFIGDTVTLTYTITEIDPVKRRSRSEIKIVNQKGELAGVAQHILAWVKDQE
jgi:3-hydroxybutyryl-CoA dehydratase